MPTFIKLYPQDQNTANTWTLMVHREHDPAKANKPHSYKSKFPFSSSMRQLLLSEIGMTCNKKHWGNSTILDAYLPWSKSAKQSGTRFHENWHRVLAAQKHDWPWKGLEIFLCPQRKALKKRASLKWVRIQKTIRCNAIQQQADGAWNSASRKAICSNVISSDPITHYSFKSINSPHFLYSSPLGYFV